MNKPNTDNKDLSRREALAKLAQLSVYTAPAVATLLTSEVSYAAGSGTPAPQCFSNNGILRSNRNPNNPSFPSAFDAGGNGNSGVGRPNNTADCGIAGANSDA